MIIEQKDPLIEPLEYLTHWRCDTCGWRGTEEDRPCAPSPFDESDLLFACPDCKTVGNFTEMCDEPGCYAVAGCGWPSPDGYRRTCGAHHKWQRPQTCFHHIVYRHFPEPFGAFRVPVAEWTSDKFSDPYVVQKDDSNCLMSIEITPLTSANGNLTNPPEQK